MPLSSQQSAGAVTEQKPLATLADPTSSLSSRSGPGATIPSAVETPPLPAPPVVQPDLATMKNRQKAALIKQSMDQQFQQGGLLSSAMKAVRDTSAQQAAQHPELWDTMHQNQHLMDWATQVSDRWAKLGDAIQFPAEKLATAVTGSSKLSSNRFVNPDGENTKTMINAIRMRSGLQPLDDKTLDHTQPAGMNEGWITSFVNSLKGVFVDPFINFAKTAQLAPGPEKDQAMRTGSLKFFQSLADTADQLTGGLTGLEALHKTLGVTIGDDNVISVRGKPLRALTPDEQVSVKAAGGAGQLVGNLAVLSSLTPYVEGGARNLSPMLRTVYAKYPNISTALLTNAAVTGIQAAATKFDEKPYTLRDTFNMLMTGFLFSGAHALSEHFIGPKEAQDANVSTTRRLMDDAAKDVSFETGQPAQPIAVMEKIANVKVPGTDLTFGQAHEQLSHAFAENRLINLKGDKEGTPGIDYGTTPPEKGPNEQGELPSPSEVPRTADSSQLSTRQPTEGPTSPEAPVEPPRPKLSSRGKTQPLPLEETQPARTSRLRERIANPNQETIAEPKSAAIMQFLKDQFTAPIRIGKNSKGSEGTFYPNKNVIRIKNALDIPTAAHEVGHYIDNEFGLFKAMKKGSRFIEPYRSELMKLGEPTSRKSYTTGQVMKEGVAEFVRRYVTDPDTLKEFAPNFTSYFEKNMPEEATRLLQDVRRAHTEMLSQTPEYRVKAQISTEPPKVPLSEKVTKAVDGVFTAIDDDLRPLREFVKTAEKATGKEVPYKNDPYVLARLTRGLDGKTLQFLSPRLKPFDGEGKLRTDVRSLGAILEDVGIGRSDFEAYLVSKRAQDLHSKDIQTGIIPSDAESVIKTMEERHPEFSKLQREIVSWNKSLLEYAQQRGFLSGDQVKEMTENGDNYVPFFRAIDELTGQGSKKKFADVTSPFKRMKGSTRQIISPIESMTKNAYVIMSAVDRNRVGQMMVDLAAKHPDLGAYFEKIPPSSRPVQIDVKQILSKLGIDDLATSADEAVTLFVHGSKPNVTGENIMMVVKDGKPEYYSVDPMLYRAVTNMNAENANIIIRMLQKPAGLLRAGATLTPEFIGRNPIRDQFSATLYSRGGYVPVLDFARGLIQTIKKGEGYQRAAAGGAMQAAFVSLDRSKLKNYMDDIYASRGEKVQHYFLHPIDALRALSEFGESGTRVGEASKVFNKEMAKTGDYEEALTKSAFSARNVTLDFSRRGWAGKTMNMITAFWNATVQDTTQFAREMAGTEKGSNPARVAWKAMATITVPAIASYMISRNDIRYQKTPAWQKDYFFIYALPGIPLIKIPKPFLPGMIFGSLPQRLWEAKDAGDLRPIKDFFTSLQNNVMPGMIPTALQPIIEYATNYSFFFGRQIVPQADQGLLPADQFGIYTPETYKAIGNLTNVPPLKIESLVYGYTAGLGRYGSQMLDFLGAKTGVLAEKPVPPEDITQYPIIRGFTISDLASADQNVDDFYNLYTTATQAHNSLNNAFKTQDIKRAKDIRDTNLSDLMYITPNGKPSLLFPALDAVASSMSDLKKERDTTIESTTMSPKEKSEKIIQINGVISNLARKAMRAVKNRPSNIKDIRSALGQ